MEVKFSVLPHGFFRNAEQFMVAATDTVGILLLVCLMRH